MQIKIFTHYSFQKLEKDVNKFLKVHNVKYILQTETDDGPTITVVYEE